MEITTAVIQEDGSYLVNGATSVPDDISNRHRVLLQAWVDDGNTPTAYSAPVKTWEENRQEAYDNLNQFEMQFDDQRDSTTTWVDAIDAIKAKHPKP